MGKRCPNNHTGCWAINHGALLWCPDCGAITVNEKQKPRMVWVYPDGWEGADKHYAKMREALEKGV